MSDEELKKLLQDSGFHNGRGPYEACGNLPNFRKLIELVLEKHNDHHQ